MHDIVNENYIPKDFKVNLRAKGMSIPDKCSVSYFFCFENKENDA